MLDPLPLQLSTEGYISTQYLHPEPAKRATVYVENFDLESYCDISKTSLGLSLFHTLCRRQVCQDFQNISILCQDKSEI